MNAETSSFRLGAAPANWELLNSKGLMEDLLPVVCDPSVPLSPNSKLTGVDGKTPSQINRHGNVSGFPRWTDHRTTLDEVLRWSADHRLGIGISCRAVKAFDIDVDNKVEADLISQFLQSMIERESGCRAPLRFRENSSRRLLLVRCAEQMTKQIVKVESGMVELLGDRQHFVAFGTHKSGARIEWQGLEDEWPTLSAEQIMEMLDAVNVTCGVSDALTSRQTSSFSERADPSDLIPRKNPDDLRVVVEQIENDDLHYDDWVKVGMSCHYESGGTDDGFAIWSDWSSTSAKHDPSQMRTKWNSFGRQAGRPATIGTLKSMAHTYVKGQFSQLQVEPHRWLRPLGEFLSEMAPPQWIIKDLFEEQTFGMVFGRPGTAKSFFAIDLALHIAAGQTQWHGREIKKNGPVAYLAGEGHGGMRRRLAAWACEYEIVAEEIPFYVSASGIDLNTEEGLRAAASAIRYMPQAPVLVVIDTLHRFLNGDENTAQDARSMIDACGKLQSEFGCTVMLVHHTGNAADAQERGRGSSAWRGALDWEFLIKISTGDLYQVVNKKSKDSAAPQDFWFKTIDAIVKGHFEEDGTPVKSAIIESVATPAAQSSEERCMAYAKASIRKAYLLKGSERGGKEFLKRADLINYLVMDEGMAESTAQSKVKPSKKDGVIYPLLQNGSIEKSDDGWVLLDTDLTSGTFGQGCYAGLTGSPGFSPFTGQGAKHPG